MICYVRNSCTIITLRVNGVVTVCNMDTSPYDPIQRRITRKHNSGKTELQQYTNTHLLNLDVTFPFQL